MNILFKKKNLFNHFNNSVWVASAVSGVQGRKCDVSGIFMRGCWTSCSVHTVWCSCCVWCVTASNFWCFKENQFLLPEALLSLASQQVSNDPFRQTKPHVKCFETMSIVNGAIWINNIELNWIIHTFTDKRHHIRTWWFHCRIPWQVQASGAWWTEAAAATHTHPGDEDVEQSPGRWGWTTLTQATGMEMEDDHLGNGDEDGQHSPR